MDRKQTSDWWLQPDRVSATLKQYLGQERQYWKPTTYSDSLSTNEISLSERSEISQWIQHVHNSCKLGPETFFVAISILDAFLGHVNAKPKYLQCIALTCILLAAKVCEEDEEVPGVNELIQRGRCSCAGSDVLRMEKIILGKLDWNIRVPTLLHFISVLYPVLIDAHPVLLSKQDLSPASQLDALTGSAALLVSDGRLSSHAPSRLALALLSTELQLYTPLWHSLTQHMCQLVGCNGQLESIRELIREILSGEETSIDTQVLSAMRKERRRKLSYGEHHSGDDTYPSIQELYRHEDTDVTSTPASLILDSLKRLFGEPQSPNRCEHVNRLTYAEVLRQHLPVVALSV